MELDAKTIRKRVTEELYARLGERWFKPGSSKLIIASTDNQTDFSIELDCYTDRRYGEYDCSIEAVLKWKKFAKLFRELGDWYNHIFQGTARSKNMVFARVSFDGIQADFKSPGRDIFWVTNERNLEMFISQCVNDLDGKVGVWIRRWFTWLSALEAMDAHPNLCGAWRDTAYYCLMEQVHGRDAACAWIRGIDATG
ncbi:MAG: hypothetical protein E5W45_03550, partial [Mesorhizobium sp.]